MPYITYEQVERVAVVSLNRPEQRNAQNSELLDELDAALCRAGADESVRVIILRANGKHFSAGHDIAHDTFEVEPFKSMFDDVANTGLLRMYEWENNHYFGYSRKWRDLPKPTIAAVQGACIAAGLMLAWPMDLIVAADDARFSDPVVQLGIGGVEYHGHAWEFGARKAKELLYTASSIDAAEAHRLGMVNHVVQRDRLDDFTMELATRIAQMDAHALRMAKRAVNAQLDAMGQQVGLSHAFDVHSLGHANAWASKGRAITADLSHMQAHNKLS